MTGLAAAPMHWALHPLYLPGRRRDDTVEPYRLRGSAKGGIAAGVGQREAGADLGTPIAATYTGMNGMDMGG